MDYLRIFALLLSFFALAQIGVASAARYLSPSSAAGFFFAGIATVVTGALMLMPATIRNLLVVIVSSVIAGAFAIIGIIIDGVTTDILDRTKSCFGRNDHELYGSNAKYWRATAEDCGGDSDSDCSCAVHKPDDGEDHDHKAYDCYDWELNESIGDSCQVLFVEYPNRLRASYLICFTILLLLLVFMVMACTAVTKTRRDQEEAIRATLELSDIDGTAIESAPPRLPPPSDEPIISAIHSKVFDEESEDEELVQIELQNRQNDL